MRQRKAKTKSTFQLELPQRPEPNEIANVKVYKNAGRAWQRRGKRAEREGERAGLPRRDPSGQHVVRLPAVKL